MDRSSSSPSCLLLLKQGYPPPAIVVFDLQSGHSVRPSRPRPETVRRARAEPVRTPNPKTRGPTKEGARGSFIYSFMKYMQKIGATHCLPFLSPSERGSPRPQPATWLKYFDPVTPQTHGGVRRDTHFSLVCGGSAFAPRCERTAGTSTKGPSLFLHLALPSSFVRCIRHALIDWHDIKSLHGERSIVDCAGLGCCCCPRFGDATRCGGRAPFPAGRHTHFLHGASGPLAKGDKENQHGRHKAKRSAPTQPPPSHIHPTHWRLSG